MCGNVFPSACIGKPFIRRQREKERGRNVTEVAVLTLGYGCLCCRKRRPSRNPASGGPEWRPPPYCPDPTWRRFCVPEPLFHRPLPRRRSPRRLDRRCRPIPDTIHRIESCRFRCYSEHRPAELDPGGNSDFRRKEGRFLKIKRDILLYHVYKLLTSILEILEL